MERPNMEAPNDYNDYNDYVLPIMGAGLAPGSPQILYYPPFFGVNYDDGDYDEDAPWVYGAQAVLPNEPDMVYRCPNPANHPATPPPRHYDPGMMYSSPQFAQSANSRLYVDGLSCGFTAGLKTINDEETMMSLCGVSLELFSTLLPFVMKNNLLDYSFPGDRYRKLCYENSLAMFLMKIKRNLSFRTLGLLFDVTEVTAAKCFFTVLDILYNGTKTWIGLRSRTAKRERLVGNYPRCRAIIKCMEIPCVDPPELNKRLWMYSPTSDQSAVKYLIGLSPGGVITFLSQSYGGRTTNEYMANNSTFFRSLDSWDTIISDEKYTDHYINRRCRLIAPYSAYQTWNNLGEKSHNVVTDIVDSALQRIKLYKILENVKYEFLPCIDKIVHMACVFANEKLPLMDENQLSMTM